MFSGDLAWVWAAIWWAWVLQAGWSCYNQWHFLRRVRRWDRRHKHRDMKGLSFRGPAVVIVAIKGVDERFERHIAGLTTQDYPQYRLIFTVESEDDPAHAAIAALIQRGGQREIELVVADRAERGGQKVHNLLAALRHLRDTDEAIVFADADVVPDDQWLGRMVGPLVRDWIGAATGYRWLIPADEGADNLPMRVASVINSTVATLQGPPRRTHAWGGSTALLRRTLDEAKVVEHWQGALSDDYQMSRAIRRIDKVVFFVPRCLVGSPARFTWSSLMEFGRRQYVITRVHAPMLWLLGLLFTAMSLAGWLSVIIAAVMHVEGWGWGLVAAAAVYLLDLTRGHFRARVARFILGDAAVERLRGALALDRFATPLVMAVHLLLILRSALGRRITWAGITYHMRGRQDVEIEGRGPRE